jgi:PAS domain S-box-containing protein
MMLSEKKRKHAPDSVSFGRETETGPKDQLLCRLELQQTIHLAKIQELEKLGAELESTRGAFEVLYEHSPVGYITLDHKGTVHNANAAILALLGRSRNRLINLSIAFVVHRDDLGIIWKHLARCEKAGHPQVTSELRLKARNHTSVTVQFISVAFASSSGHRLYLTAVVDLSERIHQEEALSQAKDFAEAIVQTVRHPVVVLDPEFRIISVNRAFSEFFKRPSQHVRGLFLEVLLNQWWSGNQFRERLDKVLLKNEPMDGFGLAVELPGLGRRVLQLSARPLCRKKDSPDRILVLLEDISEQEQARETLRKMNDELEKRVAARTEALRRSYEQMEAFCYSIAHDLRAPLRAMSGFSQLLAAEIDREQNPGARDYAERIRLSADRMDRLINDLLEYGRLNTIDLPVQEVNLENIFEEVRIQLAPEIEERGAHLVKKGALPGVLGNPVVLHVALSNLLSNAVKFVPSDTRPKIIVRPEIREERLRLWVEDNGIGIAPANHHKIFGVFQRLHKMDSYPGTGIGLALVSKGLERIGGRFGLESALGQGSKFWMELKLYEADGGKSAKKV